MKLGCISSPPLTCASMSSKPPPSSDFHARCPTNPCSGTRRLVPELPKAGRDTITSSLLYGSRSRAKYAEPRRTQCSCLLIAISQPLQQNGKHDTAIETASRGLLDHGRRASRRSTTLSRTLRFGLSSNGSERCSLGRPDDSARSWFDRRHPCASNPSKTAASMRTVTDLLDDAGLLSLAKLPNTSHTTPGSRPTPPRERRRDVFSPPARGGVAREA